MADIQDEVIAFLADPRSHGPGVAPGVANVERLTTHISVVVLAGEHAFKLKRAVRLPYVDFSTLDRRRQACAAELALNRRTAPRLYLELRAICRRADGTLAWGEDGEIVDWVVVMRRFDQSALLDAIAKQGVLPPPLLHAVAAHIADFHATAEPMPTRGGAAAMAAIARDNDDSLRRCGIFPDSDLDVLRARSAEWLVRLGCLFDRRRAAGKVRRGHGDLHLRNICVLDGHPVLFDCLEFSEELAAIDVLYDLAFLLMDLMHRSQPGAANLVLNRYLDLTGEDDGLAAIPLMLSLRAAIRAHVTIAAGRSADATAEARRYLDQALASLAPAAPRLVAVGGLSGTGKSTLAAVLAPGLGAPPGARVLRSDVIRKRLFDVAPEAPLPEEAYAPAVTERVYRMIGARAEAALGAGYCVVADAVMLREDERRDIEAAARRANAPFIGLWLQAPDARLAARVAQRRGDASDATTEIVARQLRLDPGPIAWTRIDAGADAAATLAAARRALGLSP